MRITGASIPAASQPAAGAVARRPEAGAPHAAGTSSPAKFAKAQPDPEASAAVARAEKAADRSRTARRDALSQELNRLIAVARKLNGVGDLRSGADALQDLARQIAKLARALAEAERGLAPADRRGVPAFAVPAGPRAQPAATRADAAAGDVQPPAPDAANGSVEAAASANTGSTEPALPTDRIEDAAPDAPVPVDEVAGRAAERARERRDDARSGREGTRQLLLQAADLLDAIRKTVAKAERFERLLDPETADARGKAGREIEGLAIELRGLAGGFADPTRGLGLDTTA